MKNPPTLVDAADILAASGKGVGTFSNGADWEYWADRNCHECRFYKADGKAGELCAFEAAAFIGIVSPELAKLFGWLKDEKWPDPDGWGPPEQCAFFRNREDKDEEGEASPAPFVDPAQLVLLADPSEDASMLANAPTTDEVLASVSQAELREDK